MTDLSQTENRAQRIGLFGGTFNPIHKGHVQVAIEVQQQFSLDHLYFIPSALPPHKIHGTLAPAADRLEMVRLALKDLKNISVSSAEIDRCGPSYTVDTLKAFNAAYEEPTDLYFLVGVDAFVEIHTWKSFRQLFDLSAFILMSRPTQDKLQSSLPTLAIEYTRHHISDGYAWAPDGNVLIHPAKKAIHPVQVTPIPIASSNIRDIIRHGGSFHKWLAPAVSEYIDSKGLYR